jgi:NAD/NADP transhydrogenase beta subunit
MSVATISTVQQQLSSTSKPESRGATVIRHAAIGGVIGAAAAAGLSFTALPFIGALSAPIAAAIGGAAGLLIGGLVGFLRSRGSGDVPRSAASAVQVPPPPAGSGSGSTPPLPPPLPA